MGISLVYPMYNERENIEAAVAHGREVLAALTPDWEIVVVDDGSDDGCAEVVRRLEREDPRVRLIGHPRNAGLGLTLREGFAAARHDTVLYCDSDLPYDLSILGQALPLLDGADLVAGFRLNRGEGLLRHLYSKVYNGLIQALFPVPARDVNFSFKLMRRGVLDAVHLESRGSFIDAELLIKAHDAGLRIVEFGIAYTHRAHGISKLSSLKTIAEMLSELLRQRRKLSPPAGYAEAGLLERLHIAYRWRSCPFEWLETLVPTQGKVFDLGCGHGLFAHWMAVRSPRREVTGWDPDARKTALARRHLPGRPNLRFESELPDAAPASLAAVTIIDVLAYLSPDEKDVFLRDCREALRPGGLLLIKEIDTRPGWKYAWTRAQEACALALGLTRTSSGSREVYFESADRHRERLEASGFEVRVLKPETRLPYPHVVLAAVRRA